MSQNWWSNETAPSTGPSATSTMTVPPPAMSAPTMPAAAHGPVAPVDLAARRNQLIAEANQRRLSIAQAEEHIGRALLDEARAGTPLPAGTEPQLAAIHQATAELERLRQQMAAVDANAAAGQATIRGAANPATNCPACRAPRVSGERFCARCGERLPAVAAAPVVNTCDRCGREVKAGAAYCTICGWRVAISSLPWWKARWIRVLVAGLLLYAFAQTLLPHTGYNTGFIAVELLLGGAVVPVTFVVYFYERGTLRQTPLDALVITFVLGAILGTAAAVILEQCVHIKGDWSYIAVGFIEEGCKGAIVLLWLRRRDLAGSDKGFVIGAATGMGFAAIETIGVYGLGAFISGLLSSDPSRSIPAMVSELNVRGVLAPLGHGTWTGILAGVIWYERSSGRPALGRRALATYVAVSLLHGLYDISASSHVMLVSFVSGSKVPFPTLLFGLLGLIVLLAMVRLIRQGKDPIATILHDVHRLQGALQGASHT